MTKLDNIPQPPGWPIVGNIFDIDMELPLFSLYNLAEKHGEIYRMKFPGHTFIIATSYDMVNEFCDEKRFPKTIFALREMRHAMHDGLFTVRKHLGIGDQSQSFSGLRLTFVLL